MEWITNNWYIVVATFCMVAVIVGFVMWFFKLPNATKIANIKEWLKWAVTEAEKQLGAGTGQVKLRLVYNMAVEKFPWLVSVVSFNTFSIWVDEALDWMKKQLENNNSVKKLVEGVYEEKQ